MAESIQHRLNHIRRRIRQVLWVHGMSWLVVVVFGAALVVGFTDWLVHLDDPGVRLVLALGILAAAGWVAWRHLVSPLLSPLSDVDLALRVERRFRGFDDSLASSVQFLEGRTDPGIGSPELQRQVISQTLRRAADVDLSDVIETRGVRRIAGAAIAVCLLTATIVGFNQLEASIAVKRLLLPLAETAWPKTTELRVLDADFRPIRAGEDDPLRVARGESLELIVENVKGELPDDARIEYRFEDGELVSQKLRRISRPGGDGDPGPLGVARLTAARGPIRFRAVGGDDRDNPFYHLLVVPPPLVEELRVTLTPPAYSQREPERLSPGVGHVEGLVGTHVAVTATINKPLDEDSASLRVGEQPPTPVQVSAGGTELQAEFVIGESGVSSYWFDLRDRQGFENPEAPRYEIRGTADLVPEVRIEQPATDMAVTADAEVPLVFQVRDDLGLKDVRLHYRFRDTGDTGGQAEQLLRDGRLSDERPTDLTLESLWRLSELSLPHGTRLVFHAEATDHFDLGPEHVGRSISRTLTVVSPQEKIAELASRQKTVLEELDRAFKDQSRAHQQVGELVLQLDETGSLRPEDLDLLKRIEIDQRQISARLLNPVDGIQTRVEELLEELKNNRLQQPQMQGRLGRIAEELRLLQEDYLPAVSRQLLRARKAAQLQESGESPDSEQPEPSSSEAQQQGAALQRAGENQTAVIESLAIMRRQLARWRNRHDIVNELDELIGDQGDLNRDTAQTGQQTLGRNGTEGLTPQQRANLAKLSNRQSDLAERLAEFDDKLRRLPEQSDTLSQQQADTISDARDLLRRQATGSRMRAAADRLETNKVGEAALRQQEVLADLQELREILGNNRADDDAETLVKKLRKAEDELSRLSDRQQELLRKVQQAAGMQDRRQRQEELQQLKKQQQSLRDDVARMARQLRRMDAEDPGDAAGRAAERMRAAENDLRADDADRAAAEQQQALQDIAQARRELAQQRRRAEERLARETLQRVSDKIDSMIEQQQAVIEETERLEAERKKRGNWSRGQLASLLKLEETQRNLQKDTSRLSASLETAEVFALALEGAARSMERAASRLSKRETGRETVALEEAARKRFADLAEALKSENGSAAGPQQAGGPQGQGAGAGGNSVPQLAQLRMLKTLQEDLLRRTAELDERRRTAGRLTPEQLQELEQLAERQGRLADLARNLTADLMPAGDARRELPVEER